MSGVVVSAIALFASSESVAALEAQLSPLEGPDRLQVLIPLAWQLRQRECDRALLLAEEAEAWLNTVNLDDGERQRSRARLSLVRGEVEWLAASLDRAEALAEAALAAFLHLGDPIGTGDAKWLLAFIWQDRGDIARRDECLASATVDFRQGDDPVRVQIATARALQLESFHDAKGIEARLAEFGEQTGQLDGCVTAWLASARAVIADESGDMNAAIECFMQAYLAARQSGQLLHAILSATNGADIFAILGDLETALEWDERALALARGTGRPSLRANPLIQTGNVLHLLGRHAEAKAALDEALGVMGTLQCSTRYAIARVYLGELALDENDPAAALVHFREAEALAKALKETILVLSCLRGQAKALCRLARAEEAIAVLVAAFPAVQELGYADEQIKMLRVFAELHQRYCLPPPEGMTALSAELHYLNQATAIAGGINGYMLSGELLDEVAGAYARCGDYRLAFSNAQAAAAARNNTRLEEARNRAIAMKVRQAIEFAQAEANHQRQLAQMEAERAKALQETITTLETLGLIGRRITANLDLEATLESLYGAINEVMDAPSLAIGVVDEAQACLDYRLVMTQGKRQKSFRVPLAEASFGCWCATHRRDILIGDLDSERGHYLNVPPETIYGDTEKSLVFVPLQVGDRVTGMLTVQSPKRNAYDHRTVEILRAIGAYIAIAIENASLFHRSLESERSLRQEHTALLNAQAELKKLHGVIPICSACKKIRDDGGAWHQLESYIRDHSEAEFTHGICPDCVERLYGDLLKPKGSQPNG